MIPRSTLLVLVLCSCSIPPPDSFTWVSLDAQSGEVVFDRGIIGRVGSSLDGTIFVLADSGFYRSGPSGQLPFERMSDLRPESIISVLDADLPGSWVLDTYAPNRDLLFAASDAVWRWEFGKGWERAAVGREITKEQMRKRCNHCLWVNRHAAIRSIWGRSPDDVYAVGEFATILHYDGTAWTEERNPLIPYVDSAYAAGMGSPEILGVGGNDSGAYAVTTQHLLVDIGSGWELVERPKDEAWKYCGLRSLVATPDEILVAGGAKTCFATFVDGEWRLLSSRTISGINYPAYGALAVDGSAVFHSPLASPFVVIADSRLTVFTLSEPAGYGAGVILTDSHVYVATKLQLFRFPR